MLLECWGLFAFYENPFCFEYWWGFNSFSELSVLALCSFGVLDPKPMASSTLHEVCDGTRMPPAPHLSMPLRPPLPISEILQRCLLQSGVSPEPTHLHDCRQPKSRGGGGGGAALGLGYVVHTS